MPHFDVHFATGCVLASIGNIAGLIPLEPAVWGIPFFSIPFNLVVACAVVLDFDYALAIPLGVENHRRLFTHSAWPGVVALACGAVFGSATVLFCGVALLVHVGLDAVDWGTNLLGDGKVRGPAVVMAARSASDLKAVLGEFEKPRCYFVCAWYRHRGMQALTVAAFSLAIATGTASGFGVYFLAYFPPIYATLFGGQFSEYLQCRKREEECSR
ncbi:MAG: hypothetical protein ACTSU5_10240 [Promethearchaeota archaeon]